MVIKKSLMKDKRKDLNGMTSVRTSMKHIAVISSDLVGLSAIEICTSDYASLLYTQYQH